MRLLLVVPLLLTACGEKSIALGQGSPADARFISDLFAWNCEVGDTGGSATAFQGVFGYDVTFEYAPDDLASREVPASGCSKGIDLFPADAGSGAVDLGSTPSWSFSSALDGRLDRVSEGFYQDEAFDNQHTCLDAQELLAEGTLLEDADAFSGARTPAPGSYGEVTVSAGDDQTGIPYGSEVSVTWAADDWQESWVQIRREDTTGALVESVTCATDVSSGSYVIDDDVWSLFNGAVETPITNLYVGMQSKSTTDTEDGQKIETLTRAISVTVVNTD